MGTLSRRDFMKSALLGMGATTVALSLVGCGSSHDKASLASNEVEINFKHGVASGDPLADSVILWTRVTPEGDPNHINLTLQVSEEDEFTVAAMSQSVVALKNSDYTVKVDLAGLKANTRYYYRFVTDGTVSPIGQCKTLPQSDVSQVKFAVLSCANYPAGYFHAYAHAATMNDLDAVLHLGDYIYEYGMGEYATERAEALGRALDDDNSDEVITLEEYRKRYAKYRTDDGLQALHQKAPFIAVWDDHEICNDTYTTGAENHNAGEGEFSERKLAALQAYYEWMPVRPYVIDQTEALYRKFEFGDLVSLYMLDTRNEARAKPLEYQDYLDTTSGAMDFTGFQADLVTPKQQLLGTKQLTWLTDSMKTSNAKWQVLGQQVLMTKMMMPAELLTALANPSTSMAEQLLALAQIKGRAKEGDPSLTEQELTRVNFVAPYNLDAWDGYPVEREVVLQTAKVANKNLVVLAGDTHNAWSGRLCNAQGDVCGYEFATPGVSSPGLEYYLKLPDEQAKQFANALQLLIDDLDFANIHQRGFMTVTFTADSVDSEWHFVSSVHEKAFTIRNSSLQQRAVG
ncbi:alkaline phosphatase D family protein [Pseudoalteromonas sp. MMG013]|uniref:alkaline phosphatase D family protein n=1 Tax=unclassified Pseudoalteromonas TaxID=194690 RepID=UPI001B35E0CB|nr:MULTISPECIES: alkaline phosphatase D family protein [unclassified Pseudoalteromonas]MBQ4846175.1 alkaline phosphatase D family protein [Pseudoalteromonas sp. MMG005]MBQ4862539.1 alkaline phosphatase D family protein [Pseudoalteromonas sp. MMG013]